MNIRTLILSSALLVAVPLFARENTDVLVMKNGDRMTCQVKGLDTGVLYVSFDYIDGTTSGSMVQGGPPGKQTIVHCENPGRLGVHREA